MSMHKDKEGAGNGSTSGLVDSVDQMVKWPLQMTGATWDFMMQGMRNMTGQRSFSAVNQPAGEAASSAPMAGATFTGGGDQDLGGDDLKFVVWSLVFTKPGYECVLEAPHSEIVNYSADGASYAAVKIARFLEKARHGHVEKGESWESRGYPPESSQASERRTEVVSSDTETVVKSTAKSTGKGSTAQRDHGWRIPPEDQKFITFLYRVDWRLPKQEEVTRVERVTIERGA